MYNKSSIGMSWILPLFLIAKNLSSLVSVFYFAIARLKACSNRSLLRGLGTKDLKTLKSFEGSDKANLYKVLLFNEVAQHIQAGTLNLTNSDKYRSVEEYLISDEIWNQSKKNLLQRASLSITENFSGFIEEISDKVNDQYIKTNQRASKNEHLSFTSKGRPKVVTPKIDKPETDKISDLLESNEILPLQKVPSDINQSTNYLE
jgi:hypothetical protein